MKKIVLELSRQEVDLLRQWYNAVQDLSPQYLEARDHELAAKILTELGIKPRRPSP